MNLLIQQQQQDQSESAETGAKEKETTRST